MMIYEVNISLSDSRAKADDVRFMKEHIAKVLGIEGFLEAKWYHASSILNKEEGEASTLSWSVHYYIRDRKSLDSYLAHQAPAMREEAKKQFGTRAVYTRRLLELKE